MQQSTIDLEQFLDSVRIRGQRRPAPTTLRTYRVILHQYLEECQGQPSLEAETAFLDSMLDNEQFGYARACQNAINQLHRWAGLEYDIRTIDQSRPPREFLSEEQLEAVYQACVTPQERATIAVLMETALRAKELLSLEWDQLDDKNGFLLNVERKGGRHQDIPLFPRCQEALRELHKVSPGNRYIFPLEYHQLYTRVRSIGKRAGIPLHPHAMRHARASQLRRHNVRLDRIQELLGHTNPKTTYEFYAHLSPGDLKEDIMKGLEE